MNSISKSMISILRVIDDAKIYRDSELDICVYCGGPIRARVTFADYQEGRWGEVITENHTPECVIMRARKLIDEIEKEL